MSIINTLITNNTGLQNNFFSVTSTKVVELNSIFMLNANNLKKTYIYMLYQCVLHYLKNSCG
jgi:hypothetical protein